MMDDSRNLVRHAAARVRTWIAATPDEVTEYLSSRTIQDVVAYHFVLSLTAATALAAELVRQRNLRPEPGLSGLLATLGHAGLIAPSTVAALTPGLELRNRILFDIDAVNVTEVYEASVRLPHAVVTFIEEVSPHLSSRR